MMAHKRGAARGDPGGVAHLTASGPSRPTTPAATARQVSHDPRHGFAAVDALQLLRHRHLGPLVHRSPLILLSPCFWTMAAELMPEFESWRELDWYEAYWTVCSRLGAPWP